MSEASELRAARRNEKRKRRQFSLRLLLAAIAIISVALALFDVTRRYRATQEQLRAQGDELARLAAEAGHLIVDDRTQVHVLAVPTYNDNAWKWKIYLPPGTRWQIRQAVGKIPHEGFANLQSMPVPIENGELAIEAVLQRDAADRARLIFSVSLVGNRPMPRQSLPVPAEFTNDLFKVSPTITRQVGRRVQSTIDVGRPIELLRVNRDVIQQKNETTGFFETEPGSGVGVLIWLEPAP